MTRFVILLFVTIFNIQILGQVKVVATTTVIYDLVKEIGGSRVSADYICRGNQDPHFLEILPSYMLKIRKAGLLFKIGLGFELWLQQLIDGSRNDRIKVIDLSERISKKDIPDFKIDASKGDVHPYGNPHYWLDPENVLIMSESIYDALSKESPSDKNYFKKNLEEFKTKLKIKIAEWSEKMSGVKDKPFLFFHASWVYFTDRYNIRTAGFVEPKPGIPPTPAHNANLIELIKREKINAIVMENFYSDNAPNQISRLTGVKVIKVPTAVYGMEGINSYISMMDYIIEQVAGSY